MPDGNAFNWMGSIPVIGDILSSGANAIAQGIQNRKSRKFARNMYNLQKEDSLQFWNMQNEYNSPAAQARRLEEAGMNKALMYGKGASAGQAGPINTPDVQAAQFRAPQFDYGGALAKYFDTRIRQAEFDKSRQVVTNLEEERLKTKADRIKTEVETMRSIFGHSMDLEYMPDFRAEQNRHLKTDTDIALSNEDRARAMHSVRLRQGLLDIVSSRLNQARTKAETENLKAQLNVIRSDAKIKALDYELYEKYKIRPQDPIYMRLIAEMLDYSGGVSEAARKGGKKAMEAGKYIHRKAWETLPWWKIW